MSPYSWRGGVIKLLLGGDVRFSYTNAHRNTLFHHNNKYERLLGHCVLPHAGTLFLLSGQFLKLHGTRGFIALKATRD